MTLRREIGIAASLIGILINVVHFALLWFSDKPEKYHDHIGTVGFGAVLALGGLLLLIDTKKDRWIWRPRNDWERNRLWCDQRYVFSILFLRRAKFLL